MAGINTDSQGRLIFGNSPFPHALAVRCRRGGEWTAVHLAETGGCFRGSAENTEVRLYLTPNGERWDYRLELSSEVPTRVQLSLEPEQASHPFHIIPAVLFGDNSLSNTPKPIFPHLTARKSEESNCSPYWEFRADRASHPVSILYFDTGIAAVSIEPYSDDAGGILADDNSDFVRNGVFASLAHGALPCACGVTLGYGNIPHAYVAKRNFAESTSHLLRKGTARGSILFSKARDRRDIHSIIGALYTGLRETPVSSISRSEAINLLSRAMIETGWDPAAENFTDMKWNFENKRLEAFRVNDEIAWTGGTQTAFPLLVSGRHSGNAEAVEKAVTVLDRVADGKSVNPESGWLWDVCGKQSGRNINGWWSNAGAHHYAYTNGEALYYLLSAYEFTSDRAGPDKPDWLRTPLRVLERAFSIQETNGNFGYAYRTDNGEITDAEGFAGCWFTAAMARAYKLTGEERFLNSASQAMDYYHAFVRSLYCWGTPMDTAKAVDQEGVLAFIRAARILHQATGKDRFLNMLEDGARYEYLWRFAFRSRPQAPPLKDSPWNSCGGSITSTSNPHIHPMGILVSGDLLYLAGASGNDYHRMRAEDGLNWSLNSIELYPGHTGYGTPGVLTERFCPSDGLLSEKYPDGSPSSVWFSYHVWGAACVLEGLLDAEYGLTP
ncbi:MAG: hypothetical protein R6V03_00145 [Kiritimatiellia bacterium]